MAEPKKFVRSSEWDLEKRTPERGKKNNQKLKPYVVLQYLLKNTDELHVATASDSIGYLEDCRFSMISVPWGTGEISSI